MTPEINPAVEFDPGIDESLSLETVQLTHEIYESLNQRKPSWLRRVGSVALYVCLCGSMYCSPLGMISPQSVLQMREPEK